MNAHYSTETLQSALTTTRARLAGQGDFLILRESDGTETRYSFDQLIDRAEDWAWNYRSHGIVIGDRIIVTLEHSFDLYAAYIGAILIGAVPSMFAHPSAKHSAESYFSTIGALLTGSHAKLLVTYDQLAQDLEQTVANIGSFQTIVRPQDVAEDPRGVTPINVPTDSPAFLQYSSGTTGLKKGVVISHQAIMWQVKAYADAIGLDEKRPDRILSWLPLYHDMGLITCLFLPLLTGTRLVAMSPFDWVARPSLWAEMVTRHRATLSWLPNFAYNFMARHTIAGDYDFSSLRGIVNCSEPVLAGSHDEFLARFKDAGMQADMFAASYAMAENTYAVTSAGFGTETRVDHIDPGALTDRHVASPVLPTPDARRIVSSGRALADTRIEIVDDQGSPLPDRQVGEIRITSPCLFAEYDGNALATAKVRHNEWYLTGDLGYLAEGHLYVLGRADDLIIIGGKNIHPGDIETIANNTDGVLPGRSVALGIRNEDAGTNSLVILAESAEEDERWLGIADSIRQRIAATTDVVVGDIRIVPHKWLAKSTSGKIARPENTRRYKQLLADEAPEPRKMQLPATAPSAAAPEPVSHLDRVRQVVCNDILRDRTVADDAPLISSGLIDSFSVVNLILALERQFELPLPESIVGETARLNSIAAIADTIESLQSNTDNEITPAAPALTEGDIPLVVPDFKRAAKRKTGFWTWYYRCLFRLKGIRYGKGLQVLGPILLRTDGDARNISFGDDVTIMPWVDLKVRENGRIIVGNGCALDTTTRLVAANDARIVMGDRSQLAMGTVINAGEDVIIGRDTATAGNCNIIASEHKYDGDGPIMQQGYRHEPVLIGADVWLASNVLVTPGAKIGNGSIIAAHSTITGEVPGMSVIAGNPARVIKRRKTG